MAWKFVKDEDDMVEVSGCYRVRVIGCKEVLVSGCQEVRARSSIIEAEGSRVTLLGANTVERLPYSRTISSTLTPKEG